MAQEIADSKLIDTWSSSGLIVKPDISKIIEGWQLGEQPPHEYMNWLQNTFGSKLNHILKNGVPLWNNTTQYLAGSSVQHSGNVWLCKTTNTNSAPTDANANWKRIITVEALTTVLNGYVALTGNQTIAGVKTFSSSPIVPTPTTGTQAVNKTYVEDFAMNRNAKYLTTENLNDLTNGFYTQNFTVNATLERNYPVSIAGNLFMHGEGDKFVQYYVPFNTGNMYIRVFYASGWSPWQKFATETELNTKDSQNVKLTGNQTIEGIKTFSTGITMSSGINDTSDLRFEDPTNNTSFLMDMANESFRMFRNFQGGGNNQILNISGISGTFNFTNNPTVSAVQSTATNAVTRKDYVDGLDSANVKLTGNQTIEGIKTFSSSPIVPTPTADFQATASRSTNITVNVGAGQTYTTINQALEYLSGFYPLYKKTGVTATINLKAGFVMAEQVLVSGLNLGWITIVGESAETIITHTALTTIFNGNYPAFGIDRGGTSPVIGQLFRFNVEKVGGNKHGIMTYGAGSSAEVLSGNGFIGAGTYGIYAQNSSTINANGANMSNAGTYGIYAQNSSTINANGANMSNAGTYGIYAQNSSTINASGANMSNAGTYGISAVESSTINVQNAIIQNQTTGTSRVQVGSGSIINARGINTTGGTVPALSQTANTLTGNGIIFQ